MQGTRVVISLDHTYIIIHFKDAQHYRIKYKPLVVYIFL